MKPPYDITTKILKLITSISEKIGEISANLIDKPSPQLRKQNKIKTIHSSLRIEGNILTQEQVTAIIENKRVIGPKKDVIEVLKAIKVYDSLTTFNPVSSKSFLSAHKLLMNELIEKPGKYRSQEVGIFQGANVAHIAPPSQNVPHLMADLFKYLKNEDELVLIKGCVFHYEMEFIHPFTDGNGRMGRLWQTVILMQKHPVFEFLPLETLISQTQQDYYYALSQSDKAGRSTLFIEYMLDVIDKSLNELLSFNHRIFKDTDRLNYFVSMGKEDFTRKDYMNVFKDISSATASRDLKKGVEINLFYKTGNKNRTVYKLTDKHKLQDTIE
ncbi:MAG: Fic family protein [Bacteroidales bacterium]